MVDWDGQFFPSPGSWAASQEIVLAVLAKPVRFMRGFSLSASITLSVTQPPLAV
jgi:hypothetical protein